MIFPLIISLVSIAVSAFFPFIKYLNHKEYNKYKELINYGLSAYSKYKAAIEFYLKNGYAFRIQPLTINYGKCYNLHIKIYKTAGTRKNIDDIFGVTELIIYDVNDYTLFSFIIDAYDNVFAMYNANSVAFIDRPIDDEKCIIKLNQYFGYSPEEMFMLMLIDYCNGKLDYYKKLIKGYEYYTFDMFLCGRYAIYSNKYTI